MKNVLALISVLLLVACGSTPETRTVLKTEYRLIEVPAASLKKCEATPPPDKKNYLDSDPAGKENLLATYSISLLKDLKNCNQQIQSIIDFQNKEKLILLKTNKK